MKRFLLAIVLSTSCGSAALASGATLDELVADLERDGYSHIEMARVEGRTTIHGYKDGWHRTMVLGKDGAFESSWQLQAPNATEAQARIETVGSYDVMSRLTNLVSLGSQ